MPRPSSGPPPPAWVIVPAGGSGSRMGSAVPKQFLPLGGVPILIHTLRALLTCPLVAQVVPVVPEAERGQTRDLIRRHALSRVHDPVAGGMTRQGSVLNGLAVVPQSCDVIAVHDAVRPFPDPAVLAEAIRQARTGVGVVVGRPVRDTIKEVAPDGRVIATPDRSRLWQAFTPQVFPATMFIEASAAARRSGYEGTDDAALAEHMGATVVMLEGTTESLKITTPEDLATAHAWLKRERGA